MMVPFRSFDQIGQPCEGDTADLPVFPRVQSFFFSPRSSRGGRQLVFTDTALPSGTTGILPLRGEGLGVGDFFSLGWDPSPQPF